jgi:hypothetical protein
MLRPLRTTAVRQGDVLVATGFDCIGPIPEPVVIHRDNFGCYFLCANGRHYLKNCENEFGELIGLKRESR